MSLDDIIKITSSSFFATRDSIEEALDYAEQVAKATDNPGAVLTAIGVVMNAISDQLKEVKLATEENPMDKLEEIVAGWVRASRREAQLES